MIITPMFSTMLKSINASLLTLFVSSTVCASNSEPADSIKDQNLNEVVVEARMQRTSATVSTYIPTAKQKNASQTGTDLLNRMGIPQLRATFGDGASVSTVSGQAVDLFIDYLPASSTDLSGMKMEDVKKVEYYDFPDDPRFLGKAHVVNFVMQKYEYGGYVKAFGNEFFIANSGQLNLYSKFQYKRMTYDFAAGGYYGNFPHDYSDTYEVYRLPQPDGSIKEIDRNSVADYSKYRRRFYWPTFKATYITDKITMQNIIGTNFDHYPTRSSSGTVQYSPSDFAASSFGDESSSRSNSVTYNGYWNFILPKNNTINFIPYYSYSHTNQQSLYEESDAGSIVNNAKDNTHSLFAHLNFSHSFGKAGTLQTSVFVLYSDSHTVYSGTTYSDDRSKEFDANPRLSYTYNTEKFYGHAYLGWAFNRTSYGDIKESSNAPTIYVSAQYSPTNKHSIQGSFNYNLSGGASGNNSTAIFHKNPLFSYTGNPALKPTKNYNSSITYTWLPTNKFNLSAYGALSAEGDRYAYLYVPTATGILRTIIQPAGGFSITSYGLSGTLRLFESKLQLTGQVSQSFYHNGYPYGWNKNHISFSLMATYYAGKWNFGGYYISKDADYSDSMDGAWVESVDYAALWAGWSTSKWNIKCTLANPYRWNWRESTTTTKSEYFDQKIVKYNTSPHCFVQLSATYTLSFGKKIEIGDEAGQQTGASSGIMK